MKNGVDSMNSDNGQYAGNGLKKRSKEGGFSKASLILSATPIAILLIFGISSANNAPVQ